MKIFFTFSKIALIFALTFPAFADTSVWKVSKGGNHVYIAGTIHLLKQSDYPLPEEFEKAYKDSEHLVFEADASAAQSMEVQQKILPKIMYSDGRTLQTVLSPEVYSEVEQYFKAKNVPMQMLNMMRPGVIAAQMTVLEAQNLGMTATAGVDMYFITKSMGDGKTKGYLETIDQQVDMLIGMGEGNEDELILYTMNDLKNLPSMMADTISAWRSGDLSKLDALMIDPMAKEFPDVYKQVIYDRNAAWIPQIEQMLADKKVEYILVGAGHLAGKDSVLKMLEDKGYKVKQL